MKLHLLCKYFFGVHSIRFLRILLGTFSGESIHALQIHSKIQSNFTLDDWACLGCVGLLAKVFSNCQVYWWVLAYNEIYTISTSSAVLAYNNKRGKHELKYSYCPNWRWLLCRSINLSKINSLINQRTLLPCSSHLCSMLHIYLQSIAWWQRGSRAS